MRRARSTATPTTRVLRRPRALRPFLYRERNIATSALHAHTNSARPSSSSRSPSFPLSRAEHCEERAPRPQQPNARPTSSSTLSVLSSIASGTLRGVRSAATATARALHLPRALCPFLYRVRDLIYLPLLLLVPARPSSCPIPPSFFPPFYSSSFFSPSSLTLSFSSLPFPLSLSPLSSALPPPFRSSARPFRADKPIVRFVAARAVQRARFQNTPAPPSTRERERRRESEGRGGESEGAHAYRRQRRCAPVHFFSDFEKKAELRGHVDEAGRLGGWTPGRTSGKGRVITW